MTMLTDDYDSTDATDATDEHREGTGEDRVDAALQRLAGLGDLPLAAQVTVFDDVHRLLQDALTGNEPGGAGDPGR